MSRTGKGGAITVELIRLVVRSRPRTAPRLVMPTADHSAVSRAECLAAGADDVQTKPLDLAKLTAIVAAALEIAGPALASRGSV